MTRVSSAPQSSACFRQQNAGAIRANIQQGAHQAILRPLPLLDWRVAVLPLLSCCCAAPPPKAACASALPMAARGSEGGACCAGAACAAPYVCADDAPYVCVMRNPEYDQ